MFTWKTYRCVCWWSPLWRFGSVGCRMVEFSRWHIDSIKLVWFFWLTLCGFCWNSRMVITWSKKRNCILVLKKQNKKTTTTLCWFGSCPHATTHLSILDVSNVVSVHKEVKLDTPVDQKYQNTTLGHFLKRFKVWPAVIK